MATLTKCGDGQWQAKIRRQACLQAGEKTPGDDLLSGIYSVIAHATEKATSRSAFAQRSLGFNAVWST